MHATTPLAETRHGLTSPLSSSRISPAPAPVFLHVVREVSHAPTAPMARRGRSYQEIAAQPLGRAKLWLGYSVVYPGLCYLPMTLQQRAVCTFRQWLHGDDEHADLRALIEHGIARDELVT